MTFEKLDIRPLEISDREDYFAIFSNPEVTKYDDFDPVSIEELDEVMQRAIMSPQTPEVQYGVILESENRLIGVLTVHKKRKYLYLGYHFNPRFHRKGYATRAMQQLMGGLSRLELIHARLLIHPENLASIALAQRLGFCEYRRRKLLQNPEIIFSYPAVVTQPAANQSKDDSKQQVF